MPKYVMWIGAEYEHISLRRGDVFEVTGYIGRAIGRKDTDWLNANKDGQRLILPRSRCKVIGKKEYLWRKMLNE